MLEYNEQKIKTKLWGKSYLSFSLSKCSHTACAHGMHRAWAAYGWECICKERRSPAIVNSIIKLKWNKEIRYGDLGLSFVGLGGCCCVSIVWFYCFLFCKDEDVLSVALFLWTQFVSLLILAYPFELSSVGLTQCRSQVSEKCWMSLAFFNWMYCVTRTVTFHQHQGSIPGMQLFHTLALELLLLTLSLRIKN